MGKIGYCQPPAKYRFKPGQSGNPNGRPKGSKNLSSIVRELENEEFDWSVLPTRVAALKVCGSPWRAIVYIALVEACLGDMRAAEWLRKAAYGNNVIEQDNVIGETVEPIVMSHIKPRPLGYQG